MADAETLMAAMRDKADKLRRLGYRMRFDLTDIGESVLLDATGPEPAIGPADAATEADTVLQISAGNLEKLMAGRAQPDAGLLHRAAAGRGLEGRRVEAGHPAGRGMRRCLRHRDHPAPGVALSVWQACYDRLVILS